MTSNDGGRAESDGGTDEAAAANINISAAAAFAAASASEALAVTEHAVAEATAATMRANRDRNHSTIAAASAAVAAAAASLEATEAVTAAIAAATRASTSRDINRDTGSMMSSSDGGQAEINEAVALASTIATAAAVAADEETENALLEEFLDAHATWTDQVDAMMKLEKLLLSERQHPPSLLPKATRDDGVHLMQYISEFLTRDEMKNKVKRNDIEEGGGMNCDDDRNEVVSGFMDDEEKLQSTDAPSLEELSKVLFQPGMQFQGRISIPGLVGVGGGRFSAEYDEDEHEEDEDEDDEDYDEDEDEVTMEEMDAVMSNGMFIMGQDFPNFMQHASAENDQEEEKEEYKEEEEAEEEDIIEVEEENNNDSSIDEGMDVSSFAPRDNHASANREHSHTHNMQEGSGGNPYKLTIMQLGSDPLGNSFILAKHSAYEDEQVSSNRCVNFLLMASYL